VSTPVADNTERGLKQFVDNLKSEATRRTKSWLAEHKEMPADAQAWCSPPVAALTEGEAKLVKEWIEKGGKLVAMVDPRLCQRAGERVRPSVALALGGCRRTA